MPTSLSEEDPCPGRILADTGGGFAVGAVGGSFFHFIKGFRASPNGARLTGGVQALRMNAPRVGGAFAVWGGLYSTFNCTAVYLRQKEDPWNSIIAGASAGGLLSLRRGLRAVVRSAVVGGALLAMVEGIGILTKRAMAAEQAEQQNQPPVVHDPNLLAAAVINRLHAAQENTSQVDDPNMASTAASRAASTSGKEVDETK
jgi:import inner membrane translocase subunit TIM17